MDHNLIAALDFHLAGGSASTGVAALFFAFLIGHAVADFPLQGTFLAIGKERHGDLEKLTGTVWPRGVWLYCLTMHSLIHGGAVWLISGSAALGFVELALHWLIDFAKSSRWTNFYIDQGLHVVCKIGYAFYLVS
jgi:hypothetical protein